MWPRASLGLKAGAATDGQIYRMPQGRSLLPHGHNLSVFLSSAMWPDKGYSEALKEEERKAGRCTLFGQSSIR